MPAQVFRSRYIDRRKLAALLNSLYRKEDFSITARVLRFRTYIEADEDVVEAGQLDHPGARASHSGLLTSRDATPCLIALLGANTIVYNFRTPVHLHSHIFLR